MCMIVDLRDNFTKNHQWKDPHAVELCCGAYSPEADSFVAFTITDASFYKTRHQSVQIYIAFFLKNELWLFD